MKKIFLLTLPMIMLAQSFLISNIPIPKTYVQNLDPYPCSENCMQEYIDNDMIFSFLANAQSKLDNPQHDEFRAMNMSILNLGSAILNKKLKIALLLPYKRIGKYASSTTNASFAYLITRNQSFELKSYKIESESEDDIANALIKIGNDGFTHIIAPLTSVGAKAVIKLNPELNIFFPTINKQTTVSTSPFLFFGGIDYRKQSDMLLDEAVSPLVIFHDTSAIGQQLSMYQTDSFLYSKNGDINESEVTKVRIPGRRTINFSIKRDTTNLQHKLKENKNIQHASFMINTPIVKTSMIMSQLTLYDSNATNVLSTQINYDPLILSMTQYSDRKDMIISNSITEHNNILVETNYLLGNDIEYDWINYTTTVGMDYFFNLITNEDREYEISLVDNQMIYPIELLKPSVARFKIYKSNIIKE